MPQTKLDLHHRWTCKGTRGTASRRLTSSQCRHLTRPPLVEASTLVGSWKVMCFKQSLSPLLNPGRSPLLQTSSASRDRQAGRVGGER